MAFPCWYIRLRDLDGSYGLFISRYAKDRSGRALHLQLWPSFAVRFAWDVCEGGYYTFVWPTPVECSIIPPRARDKEVVQKVLVNSKRGSYPNVGGKDMP